MVTQADSTLAYIKREVRRCVASPSPSQLSESDLESAINRYYSIDFPAANKLDQLRVDLEIFTIPYIDSYSIDINKYQGFGPSILVEGYQGQLLKDRTAFFNRWPKPTTKLSPALWTGDGVTQLFSGTISGAPLNRQSVTISAVDASGNYMQVSDNGEGLFIDAADQLSTTGKSPINQTGQSTPNPPTPGTISGSINYITGAISIYFPNPPAADTDINIWAYQYQPGRPINALFFNNQITVRPIPDDVYRMEVEAFQTPTQFLNTSDSPLLNQWADCIVFGTSMRILAARQDDEGISVILPFFEQQQGLVLNRNAIEQIGQQTTTIYSGQLSGGLQNGSAGWLWNSWY